MASNTSVNLAGLIPEIIAQEIELTAQEAGYRRFRDFVVVKEDLTKRPGDTLKVPKVGRLRRAQNLTEASTLEGSGSQLVVDAITLLPTERGDELQITEYSAITSQAELQSLIVDLIADQSSKEENLTIRDEMNTTPNTRFANGVTSSAAVAAGLSSGDVDFVVDTLETNQAAKYGDSFIGFIHPYAKGTLRQNLATVDQYRDTVPIIYQGEVGMYNRTRFIETSYCPVDNFVKSVLVTSGAGTFNSAFVTLADEHFVAPGVYTLTFSSATAFTVTDPSLNALGAGTVGAGFTYVYTDLEGIATNAIVIAAAAFGGTFAATDTIAITIQQNLVTFILAQRCIAWGSLKRPTMLGAREFDYGRRLGVAWNGFWDVELLNQAYLWRMVTKRLQP